MREQIANRFIAALQEERIPWHQEWQNVIAPYNAVTGRGYRGLNYFWLACIAMDKNYADPRWCTFIQAKDKGWKTKINAFRGSKAAQQSDRRGISRTCETHIQCVHCI